MQLSIGWTADKKKAWERIAEKTCKEAPSTLARLVLEDFMACYADRETMLQLGLVRAWDQRPYYLKNAIESIPGCRVEIDAKKPQIVRPAKARRL